VQNEDVIVLARIRLAACVRQVLTHFAHDAASRGGHIIADGHREVVRKLVAVPAVGVAVRLYEPVGAPHGIRQNVRGLVRVTENGAFQTGARDAFGVAATPTQDSKAAQEHGEAAG
jgi:hypothetical protein